ncbi:hypothetical protein SSX86_030428 [Deinandra increscens subsp. villosa]|uniref:Uncharacterized protein n=1 Tax=Deinandra increscens subsp. villosa TaxID=3103831 RepID=A0AAP0CBL0_9ASTR
MNPHQPPHSSDHARGTTVLPSSHHSPPNPYIQYGPPHPLSNSINDVRRKLDSWSNKAETTATNIWTNLTTGQSVTGSAWGKMNLMAKALNDGGFESLYKRNFATYPNEKLKRTFACYLSTSTGPVAGTLYLSDCSPRLL